MTEAVAQQHIDNAFQAMSDACDAWCDATAAMPHSRHVQLEDQAIEAAGRYGTAIAATMEHGVVAAHHP